MVSQATSSDTFSGLSALHRFYSHLTVLALLLLLGSGCDRQRTRTEAPRKTARTDTLIVSKAVKDTLSSRRDTLHRDTSSSTKPVERPETRIDTISIEGEADTVRLRLVGAGWPFNTYVPEDIATDQESSEDGVSYLFYANFKGKLNRDAYMELFFPPKNRVMEDVKEGITGKHGYARKKRWTLGDRQEEKCPWADYSYAIKSGGYICIGREGGRAFVLTVRYPAAYAEGFTPRVAKILSELRWKSTGKGLERN